MTLEQHSPGRKLLVAILIASLLTVPLFAVFLMVFDRQSQSETARDSITQGWGGPQLIAGPLLVLPYTLSTTETVTENGKAATHVTTSTRHLYLAPLRADLATDLAPESRRRSIYQAVVYSASVHGSALFRLPEDLARLSVEPGQIDWARAELRFGVADPRGLQADSRVRVDGQPLAPQPGNGLSATHGAGFFVPVDARALATRPVAVDFAFSVRGHSEVALAPIAGQTDWKVQSPWPHPSFLGGFLPTESRVDGGGFAARYRISNLALGTTLLTGDDPSLARPTAAGAVPERPAASTVRVGLTDPVDLYSRINRAAKYGFLFIGFTFLAFLMFDVAGGHPVAAVEYLLVGAGLVLFFLLLLAFSEVIGFFGAYLLASGAIVALLTAYSSAVLRSWRRAALIAALLAALYAALYVLLSLEAYALVIGSLMLFAALAAVMYLTRNLEWSGRKSTATD